MNAEGWCAKATGIAIARPPANDAFRRRIERTAYVELLFARTTVSAKIRSRTHARFASSCHSASFHPINSNRAVAAALSARTRQKPMALTWTPSPPIATVAVREDSSGLPDRDVWPTAARTTSRGRPQTDARTTGHRFESSLRCPRA
jgi:hypothetical protein